MFKSFIDKFQKTVEYQLSGTYTNLCGFRRNICKTFASETKAIDFFTKEIKPNSLVWNIEILKIETTKSLVYKKKGSVHE